MIQWINTRHLPLLAALPAVLDITKSMSTVSVTPTAPPQPTFFPQMGMSQGAKIAIGLGGVVILGGVLWLLLRPRRPAPATTAGYGRYRRRR